MILDFLLNCDSMSLSTKCQLIQILTEGFTGNCTNHSEQVKQVVYGARGGVGGSVVCFGQQRRGHGAGLGADRQQQVMGGNYPKANVQFHKNVFPVLNQSNHRVCEWSYWLSFF